MIINVSSNTYLTTRATWNRWSGSIKTFTKDFCVFEKDSVDARTDPYCISTVFAPVSFDDLKIERVSNERSTEIQTAFDVDDYFKDIGCLPKLAALNSRIESSDMEDAGHVVFPAPSAKEHRKVIYEFVKSNFPYVKISPYSENGEQSKQFKAVLDTSLLVLLKCGMPIADVCQIYQFMSKGPLTEQAGRGITIGAGLDKEQRTAVYKHISKACPLLDFKTINTDGRKVQKLFWRRSARERAQQFQNKEGAKPLSSRLADAEDAEALDNYSSDVIDDRAAKRRKLCHSTVEESTNIMTPTTGIAPVSIQVPRYVKLVLVKNSMEQSAALRLLASSLRNIPMQYEFGIGETLSLLNESGLLDRTYVHSFSTSGTKDKRAITAQNCCVEILPGWVNKSNPNSVSEAPSSLGSIPPDQQRCIKLLEAAARSLLGVNKGATISKLGFEEGLYVGNVTYSHSALSLGQHWGNDFEIIIRNIASLQKDGAELTRDMNFECAVCRLRKYILPCISRDLGFPNFFGTQRFGILSSSGGSHDDIIGNAVGEQEFSSDLATLSASSSDSPHVDLMPAEYADGSINSTSTPIGARIGKHVIQSDFISAAHALILGCSYEYDRSRNLLRDTSNWRCVKCSIAPPAHDKASSLSLARNLYASGVRPSVVLKDFPSSMTKERWLLQGLVRYAGDKNTLVDANYSRTCVACGTEELCSKVSKDSKLLSATCIAGDVDSLQADYKRSFEAIPFSARSIWGHAYGSWIWNKVANYRLFEHPAEDTIGVSSRTACIGDLIKLNYSAGKVTVTNGVEGAVHNAIRIEDHNTAASTRLSSVILPLFGSHVIFPSNQTGRFYKQLLEAEGFGTEDIFGDNNAAWEGFRMKPLGGLPRGAYRNLIQMPGNNSITAEWVQSADKDDSAGSSLERKDPLRCTECLEDVNSRDHDSICFKFSLPAGSYATVFLREVLGCDEIL